MKNNQNKLYQRISQRLFPKLINIDSDKERFIITFSGVPGSGKSSLANILEDRYNAVRIGNDVIRDIIYNSGAFSLSEEEGEKLLQDYNEYFIRNYSFRNKFLILDKSMDRQYKRFFPIFEELGLRYFVIRIKISKEEAIKRVMGRKKGEDLDMVQKSMERWQKEFEDFGRSFHHNIVLDGMNPDFNSVYAEINKIISLKQQSHST